MKVQKHWRRWKAWFSGMTRQKRIQLQRIMKICFLQDSGSSNSEGATNSVNYCKALKQVLEVWGRRFLRPSYHSCGVLLGGFGRVCVFCGRFGVAMGYNFVPGRQRLCWWQWFWEVLAVVN